MDNWLNVISISICPKTVSMVLLFCNSADKSKQSLLCMKKWYSDRKAISHSKHVTIFRECQDVKSYLMLSPRDYFGIFINYYMCLFDKEWVLSIVRGKCDHNNIEHLYTMFNYNLLSCTTWQCCVTYWSNYEIIYPWLWSVIDECF